MLRAIQPCSNSLTSLRLPNQSGFCPKYPVGNTLFTTTFTVGSRKNTSRYRATRGYGSRTVVSAVTNEEGRGRRGKEWKGVLPMVGVQEFIGEKFFRMVAGATSAPVGQFIASPSTFLHSLDPRVKQAWLLALVVLPARSHMVIRVGLVLFLALLSIWTLPRDIWQGLKDGFSNPIRVSREFPLVPEESQPKVREVYTKVTVGGTSKLPQDQLIRMSLLSGILFVMLALGTDGVPPLVQMRTPPAHMLHMPSLPPARGAYSYVVMKLGPLQLTRKGLSLAATASCLSFAVLQSASLCLTTTMPEQLAAALRWYLLPLAHVGAPVDEIVLTLLLSLRFISLVFDEVRNIALGVVARGIKWKNLTVLETVDILFLYLRRIFNNLFSHAEHISQAMMARGFHGNAGDHKIYLLTKFSIKTADIVAILLLGGLMGLALLYEYIYF